MPTENLRKVIKSEFLARGWTWVGFLKKRGEWWKLNLCPAHIPPLGASRGERGWHQGKRDRGVVREGEGGKYISLWDW